MQVLITGADGFVGKNLSVRLSELPNIQIIKFTKTSSLDDLSSALNEVDFIFHLAGVNRPEHESEFIEGNVDFTQSLCEYIERSKRKIPLVFSSSTQAEYDNPYGQSKRLAEDYLLDFSQRTNNPVCIYRLPGLFGKWCKPHYNSVVATFCHNIAQGLPIQINDPATPLVLVYIDDLVTEFIRILDVRPAMGFHKINLFYTTTVGEMAQYLYTFKKNQTTLIMPAVSNGFARALYSTFVSYYQPGQFSYEIPKYGDERGVFVEMLKSTTCGQISFFTAPVGATRGEHYHHTKTEKFLVIQGEARFGFRHVLTNETIEIFTAGNSPQIVETIPGWIHNITNTGQNEMIVLLWANEIFDRQHPDTISKKVTE